MVLRSLIVVLMLALAGCANPFDWLFEARVSPPSWIHGTWTSQDRGTTFEFSPDNYIHTIDPDPEPAAFRVAETETATPSTPDVYASTVKLDLPTYRFDLSKNRKRVSVKETSTETDYVMEVKEGSMVSTFTFKRVDPSNVDLSTAVKSGLRLAKQ